MTSEHVDSVALQVTREQCEADFTFFARYFFKRRKGTKFILSAHHLVMIDYLMRVWRGEIQNLIVNMPPRYSKTELVVVLFSAWCFVKNNRCEFIHLSYADALVLENSDAVRDIIKSAEFRALWPDLAVRASKDSKKAWETDQGGKFYATAAGGQVTGFGAGRMDDTDRDGRFTFSGCLLIDDPLKPDDARSDTLRKSINDRWDNTIKSRRNSRRTPTICVMQRVHEDDFTGMLMRDTEHEWTLLSLPALVDEDGPNERALWPAKHSLDALKRMRDKPGGKYMFASQMQQRPSPLGGGLLRGEWFRRYTVPPPVKYRKIYVDTAQKTGQRNDYTVLEMWGPRVDGLGIALLDMIRGKWEAPELRRQTLDFWNKHKAPTDTGGSLRELRVEDKASGTGLIQDIRKSGFIPVYAQQRNTDKLIRMMDGAPYVESGYVWLPAEAPFVSDFVGECEAFTSDDTHAHDDQIDPMLDAIADMLANDTTLEWENMI
jgi:predicted phage terminase large subunit-like protein